MIRTLLALAAAMHVQRSFSAAELTNGLIRVEVHDEDGGLAVTDLRTQQTWRQARVEDEPVIFRSAGDGRSYTLPPRPNVGAAP